MDELETAILLCFNPPPDKSLHDKALQYCQNAQASPDAWAVALECLSKGTGRPEVAFWCCQVLHETFSNPARYPTSFSVDQIKAIREGFVNYFVQVVSGEMTHGSAGLPSFLLNKTAQVIVSIVAVDYPGSWPLAFKALILPLANNPQTSSDASTAMFFRILRTIDEDVTSIRASQLSERHRTTSMRVKDAMREDCIPDLIRIVSELLKSKFVCHSFDIVARYVEWVDIGLIVDERILQPMYTAITTASACDARPAAAAALRAIIMKRMDSTAKVRLLAALEIETLLQSIPADFLVSESGEFSDPDLPLQSGQTEVAALVNTVAMAALDILKDVLKRKKQSVTDPGAQRTAVKVAQLALPVALRFMNENAEEGTSSQTLQCVATYVNVFSKLSEQESSEQATARVSAISAILKAVEDGALLPTGFDPTDDQPEQYRSLPELRTVLLKNVFQSVVRAFPAMCVEFVRRLFSQAAEAKDIPRTELALEMVLVLTAIAAEVPEVLELRRAVIASPPPCMGFSSDVPDTAMTKSQLAQKHQLELVSTTYFNLVARSYRLFLNKNDPGLLSTVLPVFFDERGLGHRSSEMVRSQASYSLLKLARPLRSVVTSTRLEAVLNAAQKHMFPVHDDTNSQVFKDQMNIYETIGYLLGADHRRAGSLQYLSAILQPLVDSLSDNPNERAIPYLTAAGYFSKGFGVDSKPLLLLNSEGASSQAGYPNRRSPSGSDDAQGKEIRVQKVTPLSQEMQTVWVTCLEAVLKASAACFQVGRNGSLLELRAKLLFFLHRMVDTIGSAVIPYLERILPELLKSSSTALELRDALILASQGVTKFGETFEPVAFRVYAPIVERALQVTYTLDPQTLLAISEESREVVEMQRAYTYFIHALMGSKLIEILLHPNHQYLIQPVISSVIATAIGESLDIRVAASVMKMALDTLGNMVERWTSSTPNGAGAAGPSGFAQFALEKIAPATVASGVRGSIFRAGDYESSNAVSVITEIVTVHRICAVHLGNNFAEALLKDAFRSAANGSAESYLATIYSSDPPAPASLVPVVAAIFKHLRSA